MVETHKEVTNAVIIVGIEINKQPATEMLLIPENLYYTIREIIFHIFMTDYKIPDSGEVFDAIQIIKKYCHEMRSHGCVIFNV